MIERIPIACSLEGDQAKRRWQAWNALMEQRLGADRSAQHLTVRFTGDDEVRANLVDLVTAERECCNFVDWELEDRGQELTLTIRGDANGVAAMSEAFGV